MKYWFLVLCTAVAASLLVGCSKSSSQASTAPKSVDLGVVQLTYGTPSRHDLGDGLTCVLTAQTVDAQNIELLAVLEKSGKQLASTRRLPAAINQPLQLSLANVTVGLTPQIK